MKNKELDWGQKPKDPTKRNLIRKIMKKHTSPRKLRLLRKLSSFLNDQRRARLKK